MHNIINRVIRGARDTWAILKLFLFAMTFIAAMFGTILLVSWSMWFLIPIAIIGILAMSYSLGG